MKKTLSVLISLLIFTTSSLTTLQAQAATPEFQILSPTVKIISYNLTNNNHVYPKVFGSGTIISSTGLLLTNYHVVTDQYEEPYEGFAVCIVLNTNKKPDCLLTASWVASNKSLDIALLQIESKDVFQNIIPELPFLEVDSSTLQPNEKITIVGFPGIGGDTITTTEGLISGFDENEGITRAKTDATIGPGNSGGTVINTSKRFVGIPTYIRVDSTALGYIVPMSGIASWLEDKRNEAPQLQMFSDRLLRTELKIQYEVDSQKKYTSSLFPAYGLAVPDTWKVAFINDANLYLVNTIKGSTLVVTINTGVLPYKADDALLEYVLKKIEKNQHKLVNYERVPSEFHGLSGYTIGYDENNSHSTLFIAGVENAVVTIGYQLNLEYRQEMQTAVDKLFSTFEWIKKPNNTHVGVQTYAQTNPTVSIEAYGNFYVNPVYDSQQEGQILSFENPQSFSQSFTITQGNLSKEFWGLSPEEMLKREVKYRGSQLTNSYEDVVIDGLPGYAYTYSFRGDDFNEDRKKTVVTLLMGKKYLEFSYDDLVDSYDANESDFLKTIGSFTYDGVENLKTKGSYSLPEFQLQFEDIKNYLYEDEINALASKHVISAPTKNFYPEEKITRIDALKAIIESKIFVEEGRKLRNTKDSLEASSDVSSFKDINTAEQAHLANYAKEAGIINPTESFRPSGTVHLADALAMLCKAYELPTWNPPYAEKIEWYLPFIHKGIELGVIPRNVFYYNELSRGQFAFILHEFVRIVGERDDL